MKRCLRCFEQLDENTDTCPYCGYSENSCSGNDMYLAPGTLLSGRYTVGIVLEADSSSVTYAAWDNDSDLKVRIKEFFIDYIII